MNILVIWNDGVVAVAATLESVVPPAGHKYISGIRYIGSKHVSKDPHSFLQCLLVRLSFNAFRFRIRQRHDQNIRTRVCIFHVLMTKQQISSQLGWVQWVTSYDLIIKRHYTYQSITSICHSISIESALILHGCIYVKMLETVRSHNASARGHEWSLKYFNPLLIKWEEIILDAVGLKIDYHAHILSAYREIKL